MITGRDGSREMHTVAMRDFCSYWGVTEFTVTPAETESVNLLNATSAMELVKAGPKVTITLSARQWSALTQVATPQLDIFAKQFHETGGFADFLEQTERHMRLIERYPAVKDAYDKFRLVAALVDERRK